MHGLQDAHGTRELPGALDPRFANSPLHGAAGLNRRSAPPQLGRSRAVYTAG
jgi:hypothetical protein